jgi:hypothetical protein
VEIEEPPRGAGPAFWRGVRIGLALAVVAAWAATASFRRTGYGTLVELVVGGLLGLVVVVICF